MASEDDDWTNHVAPETGLEDRHTPINRSKYPYEARIPRRCPWSNCDNPRSDVRVLDPFSTPYPPAHLSDSWDADNVFLILVISHDR